MVDTHQPSPRQAGRRDASSYERLSDRHSHLSNFANVLSKPQPSGKGLPSYTSPEEANLFADRGFS